MSEKTKKIKVEVISNWQKPEDHYFDDLETAQEFALSMRDQQYKTKIIDLSEEPEKED